MKPTYEVKAWHEDGWWLARVVAASDGADPAPLNALTQARTLAKIDRMACDLIATILDADEGDFDVEFEYALPDDVDELLGEAKGARAWLDAAQEWWQERAAAAARVLTGRGYSLRETAKLLGLSHQRVDQLLHADVGAEQNNVWAVRCKYRPSGGLYASRQTTSATGATEPTSDVDVVVVVRNPREEHRRWIPRAEELHELQERIGALLVDCSERTARSSRISEVRAEGTRRANV